MSRLEPGIYTPEEAAAAMMAEPPQGPGEMAALGRRVAVLEAAIQKLAEVAVRRGDITINDVRAMAGLPEAPLDGG